MKATYFIPAVLAVAFLVACEPEADLFRTFVIRKGEHYSTTHIISELAIQ